MKKGLIKDQYFNEVMTHLIEDSSSSPLDTYTLNNSVKQILKVNIEKLKKSEASVLSVFTPEAIHDMRVAIRRIRAAIKTFKSMIPTRTKKIRKKLQKLFHVIGKKRDLDVFCEFILHKINANSIFFPKLNCKIDKAQKQIITMLKSKSYTSLIEQLKTIVTKQDKHIFKLSRNQIEKALNIVLKIAPSINSKVDDKTLHKLRISIKNLRYTCEFFESIFSKNMYSLGSLINKTKQIQDILGEHQDAITGISLLISYKNQLSAEKFKQIEKNYQLEKKKTLKSFFKIWKNIWGNNSTNSTSCLLVD